MPTTLHTSTPLGRRARLPTRKAAAHSPLPPSSPPPVGLLTSPILSVANVLHPHPSSSLPVTERKPDNDPFGFLAVEKKLKAARKRRILQPRSLANKKDTSTPGNGTFGEEEEESDGRPAFATPIHKAAVGLSTPSSKITRSLSTSRAVSRSPQQKHSEETLMSKPKSKRPTRKAAIRSNKLPVNDNEDDENYENIFAPSSDYLDTLPRALRRAGPAKIKQGDMKAEGGKGKERKDLKPGQRGPVTNVHVGAKSKTKSKIRTRDKAKDRGGKHHDPEDNKDREGGGGREAQAWKNRREGESFVLTGEEREVRP